MATIVHLSDLHIVRSANWNNMRGSILEELGKLQGDKLLVVTGDFHNYWEADYEKVKRFLNELIAALHIDREKDVFVVPGNHDVGSPAAMKRFFTDDEWEFKQYSAVEWLKTHNTADKYYSHYVQDRLESYMPYCAFVRELGIYPIDAGLKPASVHVRCWRERLNILHLNTTLTSDGKPDRTKQVDILTATSPEIWRDADTSLPALALGHNSFYDLVDNPKKGQLHRRALVAPFAKHGVCAYLCGDIHTEMTDPDKQLIRLGYGYDVNDERIPNVVGIKGASDENDTFSDFGLYLHQWDESSGEVKLTVLRWKPEQMQAQMQVGGEVKKSYAIPRGKSNSETRRDIEKLRKDLIRKERSTRAEDENTELSRALSQGEYNKAKELLDEADRIERSRRLVALGKKKDALSLLNEAQRISAKQYIDETLQIIEILKSQKKTAAILTRMQDCYETCACLAKSQRVSAYVLYDYASFLDDQQKYPAAIDAAHWLLDYYQEENEPDAAQARLRNLLGALLHKSSNYHEAEEQYRAAENIYQTLLYDNLEVYEPELAKTYYNLAQLFSMNPSTRDEARTLAVSARAIWSKYSRNKKDEEDAQKLLQRLNEPYQGIKK